MSCHIMREEISAIFNQPKCPKSHIASPIADCPSSDWNLSKETGHTTSSLLWQPGFVSENKQPKHVANQQFKHLIVVTVVGTSMKRMWFSAKITICSAVKHGLANNTGPSSSFHFEPLQTQKSVLDHTGPCLSKCFCHSKKRIAPGLVHCLQCFSVDSVDHRWQSGPRPRPSLALAPPSAAKPWQCTWCYQKQWCVCADRC